MNEYYKKYTQWLKLNCENEDTAKIYSYQLKKFFDKYKICTQENIDLFFLDIIKRKCSANTFNLAKDSFIHYLKTTNEKFKLPKYRKVDERINKYVAKEEMASIISQLGWVFEKSFAKVELILKLFFATGLRKSEFTRLKREDFDLEKGIIELKNTKGNRDRLIPLGKKLKKDIKTFFEMEREEVNAFNLDGRGLETMFNKLNKSGLYPQKLSPRLLRHSCATNLLRDGLDLFSLKEILGHTDIKITEIYAKPDFKLIREMYNKVIKEL